MPILAAQSMERSRRGTAGGGGPAHAQGSNELGFIAEVGAPPGLRPATAFLNSDTLIRHPANARELAWPLAAACD